MRPTRTRRAHACALAAAILLAAPGAAQAGGVFITGHDPDYHAFRGPNAAGARTIIRQAIDYTTFGKASPRILLVTDLRNPGGDQSDPRAGMTAAGFTAFDVADAFGTGSAFDLHTVDLAQYDVIVVASDYGGWLRQDELDVLNARSAELIHFVNAGGGLVAFAEGGDRATGGSPLIYPGTSGGRYGFLPVIVSATPLNQTETGNTVTPAGAAIGLTPADINGNASHNVFPGDAGYDVVDRDSHGEILSLATRQRLGDDGSPTDRDPDCTAVAPDQASLWPPDHRFRTITLSGATDPDGDPTTIVVDGVTQDEPLDGEADGHTTPDARRGTADDRVDVRAERAGTGDGRVYRIAFTVSDGRGGSCQGTVEVGVPHDRRGAPAVDSGASYDAFGG